MDENKNTLGLIDGLIDSASKIEVVDAPPFFKDKVLNRMSKSSMDKVGPELLGWFVPKYQVAALLLFICLNFGALYLKNMSNNQEELQTFAEAYGLSHSDDESILN